MALLQKQISLFALLTLTSLSMTSFASSPLETETARMPKAGIFEADFAVEYQTSDEGNESAIPLAFEYGITDRLMLLVEPVVYAAIRPDTGKKATGIGDLETTLMYLVSEETDRLPAIALAGEIKFPTAKNELIGTGKTDVTPFIVFSKRFNQFDAHANIGYNFLGSPKGVELKNTISYAVAVEYHATEKMDIVGEFYGNTSPVADETADGAEPNTDITTAPEIGGAEQVFSVGFRYRLKPGVTISFGVSRDNNQATLFRPAITYIF
jgi:hypothetical protein